MALAVILLLSGIHATAPVGAWPFTMLLPRGPAERGETIKLGPPLWVPGTEATSVFPYRRREATARA